MLDELHVAAIQLNACGTREEKLAKESDGSMQLSSPAPN